MNQLVKIKYVDLCTLFHESICINLGSDKGLLLITSLKKMYFIMQLIKLKIYISLVVYFLNIIKIKFERNYNILIIIFYVHRSRNKYFFISQFVKKMSLTNQSTSYKIMV